ncbi:isoleucine--tRNA ligase [Intestinimonas butyriciproducens]|uniref:Isoleucine--tRNA ligase n=1 Tax=Intestinimonas butyriciproducens TaxID=1297617 RepID=A0A2U1CGI3_9FIRM|nr:isoleucine--tRNA ligase [Intestinimonas butyriciproducens]MCR1904543.1 isoleucine--tRNA ligase [Intestinimonas butyriciproducens]PVY60013.1 isoleucyl-tRNA synthetase [Intestinimonas butyriciproducens]QBB64369.1 Isoleucyl-tRNA synthetase [Intestinimonas butyriciproducens]
MDYNKTVNLPQTDFPMRAGLPRREPEMLQAMYDKDLYHKMVARNDGKPLFVLHDGPPYANGNIHIGTALNKILKDIIVKEKNMTGYCSPYVPGWDTHGLPIESAILKNKKVKRDALTTSEFREKCKEYALDFVDKQREQFKRLGVLGEWDDPYLTLKPHFEAKQVKVFGEMAKKGFIYKGMKPVYWCPHDQTALAEAEIEYADDPCTTIFVKFPVRDDKGMLAQYCDLSKLFFVIWTTTPWTIPGNMAICLNAELDYVLLEVPSGEVYVLAQTLAEGVCKAAGIDFGACKVLATLKGAAFELMTAAHPLFDRDSVILNGEHVTLDAGTGCVHTAPGFGAEDFQICQQYDKAGLTHIGVPVPVNAKGVMTDERYNGQFYAVGNDMVVEDLGACGALLASEKITHSYPHCWRCKHPIIYRATEQWFCSVDAIKDAAVKACDAIQWKPDWGKDRMTSMITERNDWCISRQRVWGVPIPIFYCDACGADIVTPETIDHVSELFRAHGSNVWFDREAEELLPDGFKCPKCGHTHFTKETDIMDVWFDSGSTHAAVLDERPYLHFPADIYLEGGDQYRGWFQSSMLTSIAAKGVAPYRQIITHGWTVDGEGRAMHKSLGNAVAPEEIIKDYGADMLRLWVASADYTQDMRISKDIMKQLSEAYLKIRNTARYMLGNLAGFDPDRDQVPYAQMQALDRYALSRYNELVKTVRAAYDRYEFHAVYRAVYNFCVIDLSNLYLDVIKDRLYCEGASSPERRSAQTALYVILDGMTRLIAPILAFTSDEIWAAMPHAASDNGESVLLNDMPDASPALALDESAAGRWDKLISLRDAVNKALENARKAGVLKKNQDAEIRLWVSEEDAAFLKDVDLATLCIVSKMEVLTGDGEGETAEDCLVPATIAVTLSDAPKCVRCWNHNGHVGEDHDHAELCPRCAAVVRAL